MRVLLLNQFFWPDLAATSQLLTDLADHIAGQGHVVRVICASHPYAGKDCTECPRADVVRLRDFAFARGTYSRPLSYISFLAGATFAALTGPRPDIVVTMTTPPLLPVVGFLMQMLHNSRHIIWEMDLYPDAAVDLGVLRVDSVVNRVIRLVADFVRHRADRIIVLGECMRARIIAHGIRPELVSIAENWADGSLIYPLARTKGDGLTVIYPGNLGLAHDTETLAAAMKQLRANSVIRFLFVGGGPRFEPLQRFCESEGISNASFLPYCSRDRLNDLMASSEIGLVTQADACLGSMVPSKAYALIAAGLPVLFIGPSSTTAAMIERFQCGWHIRCGDSSTLTRLLLTLAESRDEVGAAGTRARQAFLEHYDKPIGVDRVSNLIGLPPARAKDRASNVPVLQTTIES